MAKMTVAGVFGAMGGKVGEVVFVRLPDGSVSLRERVVPCDPKTPAQRAWRGAMGEAARLYRQLTDEELDAWAAYARQAGRAEGRRAAPRPNDLFVALTAKFLAVNAGARPPRLPPAEAFTGDGVRVWAEAAPPGVRFGASGPEAEGGGEGAAGSSGRGGHAPPASAADLAEEQDGGSAVRSVASGPAAEGRGAGAAGLSGRGGQVSPASAAGIAKTQDGGSGVRFVASGPEAEGAGAGVAGSSRREGEVPPASAAGIAETQDGGSGVRFVASGPEAEGAGADVAGSSGREGEVRPASAAGIAEAQDGGSGVRFVASGPNSEGVVTELLLQPLASAGRRGSPARYRSRGFVAFALGSLSAVVPCAPGLYLCAVRFVRRATGQASGLVEVSRVRVG
jgi:hypothetical protein